MMLPTVLRPGVVLLATAAVMFASARGDAGRPVHTSSHAVPAPVSPTSSTTSPAVAAELRRMTQELLDAVAPGHAEVWQRYLDARVIYVDENGDAKTKAELLADFRPLPAGLIGRITIGTFTVEQHGDDLAVTTREDHERLNYHGQQIESVWRTTDTWRKTADGWRLIAAQVLARPADPPETRLTQTQLCAYAGTYALTPDIVTEVRCEGDHLVSVRAGGKPGILRAEVLDVFFTAGQPRTRRIFRRADDGHITGFVDRREGHDIAWARTKE